MRFERSSFGFNNFRGSFVGGEGLGIDRYTTACCALAQLSLNDKNNISDIKDSIEIIKSETPDRRLSNGAERAVFVITLPDETELEKNLKEIGFEVIYEFHRRKCYNEEEMLKMWIISW